MSAPAETQPTTLGIPLPRLRQMLPLLAACGIVWAGLSMPGTLGMDGRIALIAVALAMLGWICTKLPESIVALTAVLGLVLTGTLDEQALFGALGSELIWLLLSAFVIAAVLRESRLTERMIAPLLRRPIRFDLLALVLCGIITATAFVLPSTSGRAALLMPVFLALAGAMPDPRLVRPLALLFPTVILLSAGASLIGAGAHLLAAESIRAATGLRIGYLGWAMLGLPFSLLASLAGTVAILGLFTTPDLRRMRIAAQPEDAPSPELRARQRRIAMVLAVVIGLWLTADWHRIGMATAALIGALVLLTSPFTPSKSKEMFRAVDVELLLYMAATVLLAQAMTQTGADRWLAGSALGVLPAGLAGSLPVVAAVMSAIAILAHLFVTSRSARAAVLIPAVALPLAGLGHDAALMVLIAVMGTGFCQTMMASAKPVAIFANAETQTFSQADLFRLSLPLMPVVLALLMGFALLIWPQQLQMMRGQEAPITQQAKVPEGMIAAVASRVSGLVPPAQPLRESARPLPRPLVRAGDAHPTAGHCPSARNRIQNDLNRLMGPLGLRIRLH